MADKDKKRERYNNDPEFRDHLKTYERERYREQHASTMRDCSTVLKDVASYGTKRAVIMGDSTMMRVTFSTVEIAEAMEYHPIRVRQWQSAGKFPKPEVAVVGSKLRVYTLQQARGLISVIAEHQKLNQYLRDSHTDTIAKLKRMMNA